MSQESVPRFNLQTMSGVFPGSRTPVFQRTPIAPLLGATTDNQRTGKTWLQLAWYDELKQCVAYIVQPGQPLDDTQPFLQVPAAPAGDFNQRLQAALAAKQQRLLSCGSCRFWQPRAVATVDGLPVGECLWQAGPQTAPLPATLALQSMLALPCSHWQPAPATGNTASPVVDPTQHPSPAPMRKAAESAAIRLSYWERLKQHFLARYRSGKPQSWQALLLERSGVGAGTENCFACQGRLANVGALTVDSTEGDKQTFSIWRCRLCYTLYLNNWIDRWERLDNLETEESYYRLAPAEAKELLITMFSVSGGEHPHRRQERQAERTYLLNFIHERTPLSHQIRQGR